ncbi:MAG: hypothetical protein K5930_10695 [Treponemataceae bacterium]|nr:hypothetical protein [Treponemataceae bacterium]
MKKALVILMALSMVFAAFADEPAVKNEVAEFKGSASVTWGWDIDNSMTGFTSSNSANLKFTLIDKGDKASSGDGAVWGDIKVKLGDAVQYDGGAWNGKNASVDYAKLHIGDMFTISIMDADVRNGGYKLALAANSDKDVFNVGAFGGNADIKKGLTFGIALPDLLNLNIDFRSTDGLNNLYGVAADIDLKAVENLTFKLGYGLDFLPNMSGLGTAGLFTQVGYKAALDDKFFIEPQVAFGYDIGNTMNLAAGVLFGWGDKNKDPIKYMNGKVSNGFSVGTMMNLAAADFAVPLDVAVYDTTFVENLSVGAELYTANVKAFADDLFVAFDAKYKIDVVTPTIACKFNKAAANSFVLYVGVDYTGIANTTFSVNYESGNLVDSVVGKVNVTAKISL